ncbi:DUF2141 domain-containing protein [Uliginosibacterium paludis]|uniref:DUF2141 domain-containing protein n=1 Tax=Uliginosibacterium paludis TaxID=1615952 RepID=A0ABV2CST3_9RHOO
MRGSEVMRALAALAVAGGIQPVFAQEAAAKPSAVLEVKVAPLHSAQGAVRLGLYADPAGFRKEARALRVVELPASPGEVVFRLEGLAPGRYALMAYHDENANGKLDLRLGMFPIEGYGLSRNPKVMGPPAFEDSAFELGAEGGTQQIEMRY